MMPGMIMLWAGSVATIPSGWTLCDGTLGTPNLVSQFVRGAGPVAPSPGSTGGSLQHAHDFTGDGHAHDIAEGSYIVDAYPSGDYGHSVESAPCTGTTDVVDTRPPFYTLCYIMKL